MAKVTDQDTEHPLYALLMEVVNSIPVNSLSRVRLWQQGKTRSDLSKKLRICWAILSHSVARWKALTPEEQQTWYDNCPEWAHDGYHYFLWTDMIQDYGGGPWKTEESEVQGHAYIVPDAAPEGVNSYIYVDATLIGSASIITP